jgi:hypothetical protein
MLGEDALEAFVLVDGAAGPPQAATASDTTVKPSRLRPIENPLTSRGQTSV